MQPRPIIKIFDYPPYEFTPFLNENQKIYIVRLLLTILLLYIIIYTPIGEPLFRNML